MVERFIQIRLITDLILQCVNSCYFRRYLLFTRIRLILFFDVFIDFG